MASSHILQIFLRVTIQNQIRIAKRIIGKEPELVGAKPLHLAGARSLCRLKAPLGLSLLRNRGILISEENKKSEPLSY